MTEWASAETLEAGAMSGAIFETYVLTEILKSYWHKRVQPGLFYYWNKDKKEIDFLIEQNQRLYPIEVKKKVSPKKDWIKSYPVFKKLKKEIGTGVVVSMVDATFPINLYNFKILK